MAKRNNENTNILIRDFFLKQTDFSKFTRKEIKHVKKLLNERPRKTLDWQTPKERFNGLLLRYKVESAKTSL
jgi:IS30 family transposase